MRKSKYKRLFVILVSMMVAVACTDTGGGPLGGGVSKPADAVEVTIIQISCTCPMLPGICSN